MVIIIDYLHGHVGQERGKGGGGGGKGRVEFFSERVGSKLMTILP